MLPEAYDILAERGVWAEQRAPACRIDPGMNLVLAQRTKHLSIFRQGLMRYFPKPKGQKKHPVGRGRRAFLKRDIKKVLRGEKFLFV